MAPKTFHRFRKLPIELRLRIWNLTMEPRVIRAKWDNIVTAEHIYQIYVLATGPAPGALHACKESREEAKRKYCLVKSRLPFSERGKYHRKPWAQKSIWINFAIDTIYFVNLPATRDFLSYMRRLSKERVGGANQNIKYIAFPASVLDRLMTTHPGFPSRLLYIYRLVVDLPSIQQIIIMLDNSKFEDDKRPSDYSLSRPFFLSKDSKAGGKWGNVKVRDKMSLAFDEFFTNPQGEGTDIEAFKKYKNENPDTLLPSFTMLSITKTPKVDYAGDGLPVDKIRKKPVIKRAVSKTKPAANTLLFKQKMIESKFKAVQSWKSR